MDRHELLAAVNRTGLTRVAPELANLALPSIRLLTQPDGESFTVGRTRVGGLPDLPSGVEWPRWNGASLAFVAQINLGEAAPYDVEKALPTSGMLYFFYDAEQQVYGSNPAERDGFRVIYHPAASGLSAVPNVPDGLPANARFKACSVRFATETTLPLEPQLHAPSLKLTDAEFTAYSTFMTTFPSPADRTTGHNRLLGHPDTLQDDMHSQVYAAANAIDPHRLAVADQQKSVTNWRLLFQMDSDPNAGMRWENNGLLYYWIEAAALRDKHFDKTWVVLQSE